MSKKHRREHSGGGIFMILLCCILAVPSAASLLPGIQTDTLQHALLAGALLGFFHILLRPVLRIATAPIGCLTLGLFGLVIDTGLLYACAYFSEGFVIVSWVDAVLTALLVNGMCAIVGRK